MLQHEKAYGELIVIDTMVRGWAKEAAAAIGCNGSSRGLTQKIDRHLFVTGPDKRPTRIIPLTRGGELMKQPDGIFERPLRAMTAMGPRVTLAASEKVDAPVELDFHLLVVGLGATEKGKLSESVLREWFSYGVYTGIGQYRTGGFGRFDSTLTVVE